MRIVDGVSLKQYQQLWGLGSGPGLGEQKPEFKPFIASDLLDGPGQASLPL